MKVNIPDIMIENRIDEMVRDFDYLPTTTLKEGVGKFVQWFKEYYHY